MNSPHMIHNSSKESPRYIFTIIIFLNNKKIKNDNSKNRSSNFSGAVAGSVGSVQFQIVP